MPSPTQHAAQEELVEALESLLNSSVPLTEQMDQAGILIAGTPASAPVIADLDLHEALAQVGDEGYVIVSTVIRDHRAS